MDVRLTGVHLERLSFDSIDVGLFSNVQYNATVRCHLSLASHARGASGGVRPRAKFVEIAQVTFN